MSEEFHSLIFSEAFQESPEEVRLYVKINQEIFDFCESQGFLGILRLHYILSDYTNNNTHIVINENTRKLNMWEAYLPNNGYLLLDLIFLNSEESKSQVFRLDLSKTRITSIKIGIIYNTPNVSIHYD